MDCNGRFSERLANLERHLTRAREDAQDYRLVPPAMVGNLRHNLRLAAAYLKDAKKYQRQSRSVNDQACGYAKRISRRAAMQLRAVRQMFAHGGAR